MARTEGLIVQPAGKEIVVYEIATDRASALSETASVVFRLCDGTRDVRQIAAEIGQDVKLVNAALDGIARANLLENSHEFRMPRGSRPSRRELMRKAGLTAAAAIPLVTTILSPSPAAAVSVGACINLPGCPCGPNNCCPDGYVCSKPRNPNGTCGDPFQCVPDGCQSLAGFPDCPVKLGPVCNDCFV